MEFFTMLPFEVLFFKLKSLSSGLPQLWTVATFLAGGTVTGVNVGADLPGFVVQVQEVNCFFGTLTLIKVTLTSILYSPGIPL